MYRVKYFEDGFAYMVDTNTNKMVKYPFGKLINGVKEMRDGEDGDTYLEVVVDEEDMKSAEAVDRFRELMSK